MNILIGLGLNVEITHWLNILKWEKLVDVCLNGYCHLIYKLYSLLEITKDNRDGLS